MERSCKEGGQRWQRPICIIWGIVVIQQRERGGDQLSKQNKEPPQQWLEESRCGGLETLILKLCYSNNYVILKIFIFARILKIKGDVDNIQLKYVF